MSLYFELWLDIVRYMTPSTMYRPESHPKALVTSTDHSYIAPDGRTKIERLAELANFCAEGNRNVQLWTKDAKECNTNTHLVIVLSESPCSEN